MADFSTYAHTAQAQAPRHPEGWIDLLARAGFVAKGIVYAIIGVLATQAAFGVGGSTTDSRGAIRAIADEPFGQVLLVLMAIGLAGYVVWRFVQAIKDPDNKGTDVEGIVKRLGYAGSGVVYALLAFTALQIVFSGGGSGNGGGSQEWTARLMAQPFGQWLVGIVGAVIVGIGLYHFYKAYQASFMKQYKQGEMNAMQKTWARRLGRFGLSARGVTFVLIGLFFIQAARQAQPSEARGLGAALDTLAQQAYGPWLLGLVALGFVAYGIYCFSRARYRAFDLRGKIGG